MKKIIVILIALGAAGVVAAGAFGWYAISRTPEPLPTTLPSPQVYRPSPTPVVSKPPIPTSVSSPTSALPGEVNLAVPFTAQAPHANWELPYQEFCEEASVLMAASYIQGKTIAGPDDASAKMIAIKDFEEKKFGYYKDTTAEETATILREYYKITKVQVVPNPTVAAIKQALATGELVLIPAAGQQLHNPYFQQPGPLYHMLVIKGYTADGKFITNDPGTRRGADFIYSPDVLLNAIHDWNGGNVSQGQRVMIVVG